MKYEDPNNNDINTDNQFNFRVLVFTLGNGILATGSNKDNEPRTINISSWEIHKPHAKFIKKYNNLYTAEKTKILDNNWSLIHGL